MRPVGPTCDDDDDDDGDDDDGGDDDGDGDDDDDDDDDRYPSTLRSDTHSITSSHTIRGKISMAEVFPLPCTFRNKFKVFSRISVQQNSHRSHQSQRSHQSHRSRLCYQAELGGTR